MAFFVFMASVAIGGALFFVCAIEAGLDVLENKGRK